MLWPLRKRAVQRYSNWLAGRGPMNFEVNGIPYFLTFDTSEAQWCLLTPSRTGIESLEIHTDGTLLTGPVQLLSSNGGARRMN